MRLGRTLGVFAGCFVVWAIGMFAVSRADLSWMDAEAASSDLSPATLGVLCGEGPEVAAAIKSFGEVPILHLPVRQDPLWKDLVVFVGSARTWSMVIRHASTRRCIIASGTDWPLALPDHVPDKPPDGKTL